MIQIPKTVLFVDDEVKTTKYFKRTFTNTFAVLIANSVDEAIQILDNNQQKIAVVIADQQMPERLGLELLDHICVHYPLIVRILTTAYCDVNSAIDAINKTQVFRYVAKPWNVEQLQAILNHALNRYGVYNGNNEEVFFQALIDDCSHWQAYSAHAHADTFVYRSGIEALSCQYHSRINALPKALNSQHIQHQVDRIAGYFFDTPKVESKPITVVDLLH